MAICHTHINSETGVQTPISLTQYANWGSWVISSTKVNGPTGVSYTTGTGEYSRCNIAYTHSFICSLFEFQ